MSKAVLISIRPKWCEKIVSGEKTIEVRKTRPKLQTPFKCYIYCTQSGVALGAWGKHDKVIGEFTCDRVYKLETQSPGGSYSVVGEDKPTTNRVARESCLGLADMHRYLQSKTGYGWHISELKIYDAPKELSEFRRVCPNDLYCESCAMYWNNGGTCGNDGLLLKRPPQSWCYVEEFR
ncbi:hypothetical protein [Vescimonas sp.]|uniref:hypothetical protein n=1 Tax=Vescimonas sp. TaxID=2892404 RepID=UPI003F80FB8F